MWSPRWSARSRRSHPVYDTPVSVTPHTTVGEALSLLPKRAHGLAVVVENGRPLGTVSEAEAAGVDRFAQVHEVMSSDLLIRTPGHSPTEIFDELTHRHLEVALLVVDGDRLLGVMTRKHALRSTLYRPALDPDGRLHDRRRRRDQRRCRRLGPRLCSTPASTCWWSTPRTVTRRRCCSR